jgi:hypothetical protein
MDVRIVRYVVHADGRIEVPIPVQALSEVLRFTRAHRVGASAEEIGVLKVQASRLGAALKVQGSESVP